MGFAGRAHHTATLVPGAVGAFGVGADDEIWVVGGTDAGDFYAEARVYTPATGEWRDETPNLSGNRELLRRAGLAASNGEARRLIKGGGARLNDAVIAEETHQVTASDLTAEGLIKLSAGRKRHALIHPV